MNVEEAIRGYIPNVIHMSLATSVDNKPWVCEVHFAVDEELNIYFCSTQTRRHSEEIAQNPNVAGNIVMQHEMSDKPRGIYFEGTAEKLENIDEDHPGFRVYVERFPRRAGLIDDYKSNDSLRLYKINISDYYMFDARDSSPAQKYHLPWHKTP